MIAKGGKFVKECKRDINRAVMMSPLSKWHWGKWEDRFVAVYEKHYTSVNLSTLIFV